MFAERLGHHRGGEAGTPASHLTTGTATGRVAPGALRVGRQEKGQVREARGAGSVLSRRLDLPGCRGHLVEKMLVEAARKGPNAGKDLGGRRRRET